MKADETVRTTVRLPKRLVVKAKKRAAAEGSTLTFLIERGLESVVAPHPQEQPRIMPRLSMARGGVRPGVDLSDGSALQDLDDLEYIERLQAGSR